MKDKVGVRCGTLPSSTPHKHDGGRERSTERSLQPCAVGGALWAMADSNERAFYGQAVCFVFLYVVHAVWHAHVSSDCMCVCESCLCCDFIIDIVHANCPDEVSAYVRSMPAAQIWTGSLSMEHWAWSETKVPAVRFSCGLLSTLNCP